MAKQIWAPEDDDEVIRGDEKGKIVNAEDAVALDQDGQWQVSVGWQASEEDEEEGDEAELDVTVDWDSVRQAWIA